MTFTISAPRTVTVPARTTQPSGAAAAIATALAALDEGVGFDVVIKGKDGKKPALKSQYVHTHSDKWAPQGKTMRVFIAPDQEGVAEDEVRFTMARVAFVQPTVRQPRKAKAAAEGGEANQNGEDHLNGEDNLGGEGGQGGEGY